MSTLPSDVQLLRSDSAVQVMNVAWLGGSFTFAILLGVVTGEASQHSHLFGLRVGVTWSCQVLTDKAGLDQSMSKQGLY